MTLKTPFKNQPSPPPSEEAGGGFLLSRALVVNGESSVVEAPAQSRLDAVLRRQLKLTSVLHGCESADCGACRVLIDDKIAASCTVFFCDLHDGARVQTAEALRESPRVRAVLTAFMAERDTRCALCVGGLTVTAAYLEHAQYMQVASPVDEALEGANCACTGRGSLKRALLAR